MTPSLRKKRGSAVDKPKRGTGTKRRVLVGGEGIPLGVQLESASPSGVTLAEAPPYVEVKWQVSRAE